ncbi:hypothetical protein RhiirA5_412249 [Rhizophagus irregularis]|uniref:Uncharacterized protein n=1 Tax=Rhizophagus irregularis TaxID=588596 RepID=A0A2N0PZ94_9GLOM|nr:hypothetical protein RhiirA5_412249 [Rhizophagus irregularis]
MPDELLTLRHKRALELLQKPGKKEHLEECVKKSSNCIKRLLAFIEYKESKAYKNGERPGSFGEILRTNSAGFTPTRMIRPGRRARLLPPESENNPIPPHIIVVNIVIKNSETKSISNSINAHDQNAKRSE